MHNKNVVWIDGVLIWKASTPTAVVCSVSNTHKYSPFAQPLITFGKQRFHK